MALKKIMSIVLAVSLVAAVSACSSESEETTTATETTTEATTTEEVIPPYDVHHNYEFPEPVLYQVIKEVTVYTNTDCNEVAAVYEVDTCINVVATDQTYVMQDNGYVMRADCLEPME